jgi:hypothetical protein
MIKMWHGAGTRRRSERARPGHSNVPKQASLEFIRSACLALGLLCPGTGTLEQQQALRARLA